jgi:hypothetical protein
VWLGSKVIKYKNRLLAFFDILGFKEEHLRKKDLDTLYCEYSSFIDKAKKAIFGDVKTIYGENTVSNFDKSIIFSDSILLISYDIEDIKNINKFLLSCITLMQEAIKHGFVLRGAIGYGEAIYNEEKNIFLSKEFAELYTQEGKQNWAGCGIFVDYHIKEKINNAVFGSKQSGGYKIFNELTQTMLYEKNFETNVRASSPILEYQIPNTDEKNLCLNYLFTIDKNDINKLWHMLENEPKGKNTTTKTFYDYMISLDDNGVVFKNLEPIFKIKIMLTQSGAKVKFEDKCGNGTEYHGQNISIGFI